MARARSALLVLVPLALLVPAACSDDDGGSDAASASGSGSASGSEAEATTTTEREVTTTSAGTPSTTTAGGSPTTTAPGGPGIRLTGPRGSGTFAYEVRVESSELCYRMAVEGIGTGTAARVERLDGAPVISVIAPESGDSIDTCVASDGITLQEIAAGPADFRLVVQGSGGRLAAPLG
jgi:hypothetical protein